MLEAALHSALLDVPRAAGIWVALLAVAVTAVAALLAQPGGRRPEDGEHIRDATRRRAQREADAHDQLRYADEVAIAAERAAATAQRRRRDWLKAQTEAEQAWRAFDAADTAARRLAAAAAFPAPRTPHTPAEYADRERYLHRAVTAACWRGELSVLELSDAVAHRAGWDPRRHPVAQEVILRRVVRDRAWAAHTKAAKREREAWQAADLAASAARTLREEAYTARERARSLATSEGDVVRRVGIGELVTA
jgi:hypothetical protein